MVTKLNLIKKNNNQGYQAEFNKKLRISVTKLDLIKTKNQGYKAEFNKNQESGLQSGI